MIHFPLDQPPEEASLVYRPWGTRTLKVRLSTGTTTPTLRIRPRGVDEAEQKQGIFRAYAGDSRAFIISWGGGHEAGPCVRARDFLVAFEKCAPLAAGSESVVYFNVQHTGPAAPDSAVLTLEAYEEASGRVWATLPVRLEKPADFPQDAIRFEPSQLGIWQPVGKALPRYDPRWWPGAVDYVAADSPPLAIQRSGPDLVVQWRNQAVATITDHTDPTILNENAISLELFRFDEWHIALRIWFFWLDKNLGGGFFLGRHEIPDAERFDFLIRQRDGQVSLACTDLHWREVWGYVVEGLPRATLGMNRETKIKLAEEKLGNLWLTWKREKGEDHDRVYNPLKYIERMAEVWYGKETLPVGTLRAKGTEAHLPMLHNVQRTEDQPPRMTSSDVRLG